VALPDEVAAVTDAETDAEYTNRVAQQQAAVGRSSRSAAVS
jgi:hypothetical protein